jgi:uncharacterized protein YbjT (DUF2867 family)
MIGVMGAAGNVGGKVADLLLNEGRDIRVLEHGRPLDELASRGAEVVRGDAADAGHLASFFEGAEAALVLLPDNVSEEHFVALRATIAGALADALRQHPVGHVVALSSVGVGRSDVPGIPAGLRELEERLFALEEINVLALRSTSYMDYLLANVPLMRAQGINGSAIEGDLPVPWIATRDVAAEAAERLVRRDFTGHGTKVLLGPEDVTMREVTAAIGQRIGMPDVPYVEFPPEDLEGALKGSGFSAEAASKLVEMQLGLNQGRFAAEVERTPENTAPTRLGEFLDGAMPAAAPS